MITIIDIGTGNLASVKNALTYFSYPAIITSDPTKIRNSERVILPGVGNFGFVMKQLEKRNLIDILRGIFESNIPFLGICVGLQILFENSAESPDVAGLGRFKGKIIPFKKGKIPQIGWNQINPKENTSFKTGYAYFVNSYYAEPQNLDIIKAETDYYVKFPSIIQQNQITAVQFHPEKSSQFGLQFLQGWLSC